eukprot:TRINITY_DN17893_c0_g1_i1.p1 TRINITY_DN17893_c0_g1~~TRINITY_DN17893_c0_g1_i1.p1  ORF type:complete len:220 (-),score=59.11 TRINITY_DN17893_c0_g1_i1:79-675(-)
MVIVLTDKQKQEISFFKTLDPEVAAQFIQLSIDFLRKGANPKVYNSASKQLEVPAGTIQAAIESMSFLIAESARQHVSPTDFIDTLHILQFAGPIADQLQEIYTAHKKEIRAYLAEISFTLPHYESLSWRLDIQLASRSCAKQVNPVYTLKLETLEPEPKTQLLQIDYPNLLHLCTEIDQAIDEIKSMHSRRVLRNVR